VQDGSEKLVLEEDQVTETCRGVKDGSEKLVIVEDQVTDN
jgi:hypothetical protein